MKILLIIGTLFLSTISTYGETAKKPNLKDSIAEVPVYDFGNIFKDVPAAKIFKIYNTGTKPVRIKTIGSPLYCTVPVWTKKPIKPGKSGLVKIIYNTEKAGPFTAPLKIVYYDSDSLENEDLIGEIVVKGSAY